MQTLRLLLFDLRPIAFIHALLLGLTVMSGGADTADVKIQIACFAFLLPGWLLSPCWTGRRAGPVSHYSHAVIGSFALHGLLTSLVFLLGWGFTTYSIAFALIAISALVFRTTQLCRLGRPRRSVIPRGEVLLWISVMLLVVVMYRMPRSNDITQFVLQQQDMLAEGTFEPSSIGTAALGVDEAMPRWRSQYWHLWPCVLADVTRLPVAGVLTRWATIPLAFAVIASLIHFVRSLSGARTPLWPVALAIFGPVVLWYRSFNAFNYSFRLTNNFCLDKDFCLFLLIPAVVYLAVGWLRGNRRYGWVLLAFFPAILKFHPLTAVYLVLLVPFVLIEAGTTLRFDRRAITVALAAMGLFVSVVLIGDAQTSHEHITRVMALDFADFQMGRPLHYWVGQYGVLPASSFDLDTNEWSDGKLHLRSRILWNCGLLAAAHLAWVALTVVAIRSRRRRDFQIFLGVSVVILTLWSVWFVAPLILTRYPHYLAGFERIHWFAYTPALVAVTVAFTKIGLIAGRVLPRKISFGNRLVSVLLIVSAILFAMRRESPWVGIRGLNSLLDFELPAQIVRDRAYTSDWMDREWGSLNPDYLEPDDRVLLLETSGNDKYWAIKQGVYWSEPYAEAFALQRIGDSFLEDRRQYYAISDHQELRDVDQWLRKKGVTLLVDTWEGGDAYLEELSKRLPLAMRRVQSGVWRLNHD